MTVARTLISTFWLAQRQVHVRNRLYKGCLSASNATLSSSSHATEKQKSKGDSDNHNQPNVSKDNDDFDEDEIAEGDNILDIKVPPGMTREMVDMWNKNAPHGPEWGGPRGYEPTKYGDWARNGRVSDF